jgi:hypothetical protein
MPFANTPRLVRHFSLTVCPCSDYIMPGTYVRGDTLLICRWFEHFLRDRSGVGRDGAYLEVPNTHPFLTHNFQLVFDIMIFSFTVYKALRHEMRNGGLLSVLLRDGAIEIPA